MLSHATRNVTFTFTLYIINSNGTEINAQLVLLGTTTDSTQIQSLAIVMFLVTLRTATAE